MQGGVVNVLCTISVWITCIKTQHRKLAHFSDSNPVTKEISAYKSHKAFRIDPQIPQTMIIHRSQ